MIKVHSFYSPVHDFFYGGQNKLTLETALKGTLILFMIAGMWMSMIGIYGLFKLALVIL